MVVINLRRRCRPFVQKPGQFHAEIMVKANFLEHVAQHVVINAVVERRESGCGARVAVRKDRLGSLVERVTIGLTAVRF